MSDEGLVFSTIHRVDAHVYIGGYLAAADRARVEKIGFTHILKLFADDSSYPGGYHKHPGIKYLVVSADDSPIYPIEQHFAECLRFIQAAIRGGGRVLVHCHAGISRSATIVLLHLVINAGLPLTEAWARLKLLRPAVHPNSGFWASLEEVDRRAAQLRREGKAPLRPNLHTAMPQTLS